MTIYQQFVASGVGCDYVNYSSLRDTQKPFRHTTEIQRENVGVRAAEFGAAANASCSAAVVAQLRSIRGKLQSQMLLIVQSVCRFPVDDIG